MSHHQTSFIGDVRTAIKTAVEAAIAGSTCEATGGGGHFEAYQGGTFPSPLVEQSSTSLPPPRVARAIVQIKGN
jgi:hypothetical protein